MNPTKTLALRPPPTGARGDTAHFSRRGSGDGGSRETLNPLAGPMYWACAELLALASNLSLGAAPPSGQDLRRKVDELFGAFREHARAANIALEDVRDAAYAVMALFDEILVQMNWPGRVEWQASPLQFVHFRENTAGDGFFVRAEGLLQQPHRAHVLLVYFLCLGLGFQGRYAVHGGAGLGPIYDAVGEAVSRCLPPSDLLSPNSAPPDLGDTLLKREAPLVRVAFALVGLAVVAFFVLRAALWLDVGGVTRAMSDGRTETDGVSSKH